MTGCASRRARPVPKLAPSAPQAEHDCSLAPSPPCVPARRRRTNEAPVLLDGSAGANLGRAKQAVEALRSDPAREQSFLPVAQQRLRPAREAAVGEMSVD